jgi:hypothetical protein
MKKIIFIVMALLIIPLAATSAHAVGVGLYVSSGSGDSDIDTGPYWWSVTNSANADLKLGSVGLVIDTNLSGDRTFNYRFELGKEDYTWEPITGGETKLKGTAMSHDFGFGVIRTDLIRFWMGPEIKLTKINDDAGGKNYDMFGFGFGIVIGLNINIKGPVTIGLKGGFLNQTMNGDVTFDSGSGFITDDISSDDTVSFLNAAVIFRFGEEY